MNAADYVYKQVYQQCLNQRIKDGIAANYASKTVEMYKKGQFIKSRGVIGLIEDMVKQAKSASAKRALA